MAEISFQKIEITAVQQKNCAETINWIAEKNLVQKYKITKTAKLFLYTKQVKSFDDNLHIFFLLMNN